jgi:SET domain-containing protein
VTGAREGGELEGGPGGRIEVRESAIQGRGVFALCPIPAGIRIIEYTGEVISDDEADRRYDDRNMDRHHTFLFSLDDGRCIDAAVGGNEARFINHSCAPNCQAVEIDGRIWIESIRPIEPGAELTYDYAYARSECDEALEALYVCRCRAPSCRGTILAAGEPLVSPVASSSASARSDEPVSAGGRARSGEAGHRRPPT